MERLIKPNIKLERCGDHIVLLFDPSLRDLSRVNMSARMARRVATRLLKLADDIMNGNGASR